MTQADRHRRSHLAPVASSGLAALDEALAGLFWGDNVVLRESTAGTARPLVDAVLGAQGYAAVLEIGLAETAPKGDPDAAVRRILEQAAALGTGALLVVDDLGAIVRRDGVDAARRVFTGCCPALLRLGAVAYWTLGPSVPAGLAEEIRRITQIVLAVDADGVAIVRAEAHPPAAVGGCASARTIASPSASTASTICVMRRISSASPAGTDGPSVQ